MSKPQSWPVGPLLWAAMTGALITLALLCLWLWTARIGGALHLPGQVEVIGGNRQVEHQDGGLIAEIFVQDGSFVEKGAPLLRLDGTALVSEQAALQAQLCAHIAQFARLTAERDGRDRPDPPIQAQDLDGSVLDREMATQRTLFDARQRTHSAQLAEADLAQAQLAEQSAHLRAQIAALDEELALVADVLAAQQRLSAQGVMTAHHLLPLQQQQAALKRTRLQNEGELARLLAAAEEVGSRRARLIAERQEKILTAIQSLRLRIATTRSQWDILNERLARLTLSAEVSGTIHALEPRHAGEIIEAGRPFLSIIPADAPLIAVAQLPTEQITQISLGQHAFIQTPEVAQNGAPPLDGDITLISADSLASAGNQPPFFRVEIAPDAPASAYLQPGMTVQIMLQMPAQRAISFLTAPVSDFFVRAFPGRQPTQP